MREDIDQSKVRDLVAAMQQLPAPKKFVTPSLDKDKIMCVCGEWKSKLDVEIINTGVTRAYSNVCIGCKPGVREDREMARIVCVGCQSVVARMAPHKDSTGFQYLANKTYHIKNCGFCEPGLTKSDILEKVVYDNSLGRKQ